MPRIRTIKKAQKSAEERIAEVANEFTDTYVRQQRESFDCYLQDARTDSDSPIEQLMAMGLVYAISMEGWFASLLRHNYFNYGAPPYQIEEHLSEPVVVAGIEIEAEVPVGKYRTDFLVRFADQCGGIAFGAIECDGHDFHDLTKEQASHDRERDRYFQSLGLIILRYPGNEIWRNPLKCAADALSILERRAKEPTAPQWRQDGQ